MSEETAPTPPSRVWFDESGDYHGRADVVCVVCGSVVAGQYRAQHIRSHETPGEDTATHWANGARRLLTPEAFDALSAGGVIRKGGE